MDSIEKLYRDKFKDFHQSPLPDVFEKINAQLPQGIVEAGASHSQVLKGTGVKTSVVKGIVVKVVAAIAIATLVTFVVVKLISKNTPEPVEKNQKLLPVESNPKDSVERLIEEKQEIEVNNNKKKGSVKKTIIPIVPDVTADSVNQEIIPVQDTLREVQKEDEKKVKKSKGKKKYDDLYKESTKDRKTSIQLFE